MRNRVFIAVCSLLGWISVSAAKENHPFPPQILAAKSIAVVAHYGLTSGSHNLSREAIFANDAEDVLRRSQAFTLVSDPRTSDLVLLLVGGYSEGFLGLKDRIVTGVLFSGGPSGPLNRVPLWVDIETRGIRSHAAAAVCKILLKQVEKARQAAGSQAAQPARESEELEPREADRQSKVELPAEENENVLLPPEIMNARKVAVILRIDEVSGEKSEQREKSVEKEIRKWGRFELVDKPEAADLLIVCARYLYTDLHSMMVFQNMMIFPSGTSAFTWEGVPLWSAFAADPLIGPTSGVQEVRWLRKRMERQEAKQSTNQLGP